jgi:tetratricopeptide (TPR) repeat protein
LDAVRLSPDRTDAKELLLRANARCFKNQERDRRKRLKKILSMAEEKERGQSAWRKAVQGKTAEAERFLARGQWAKACDRYYRVLDEYPSYLPARRGLDEAQAQLTQKLEKGGAFPTEDGRQVAQGFWFYNQKKWEEAYGAWTPVLNDEAQSKKWGAVRLGAYAAKAQRNHEVFVHQQKVEAGIQSGLEQFRQGHLEEAQASFENVLKLDPGNVQSKEYVRMIPGLLERARASVLTEVTEKQLAQTLADAMDFYLKGFYDEAEGKVDLILKQEPNHAQAKLLGEDIRQARGLPKAPSEVEIQSEKERQLENRYSEGIIAFAEGRVEDAKSAWEDVLKEDPEHSRAKRALAKISNEAANESAEQEVPHISNK